MTEPTSAVFLSYASQDAEAARELCGVLRAAGVPVWFDEHELKGGDAWDAKIRGQIQDCTLFVPLISAQTQSRPEGYFRREWRQAAERTRDMADDQPFLLPVILDDTPPASARVPEEFRRRQWMHLRGQKERQELASRVQSLLAGGELARSGAGGGGAGRKWRD